MTESTTILNESRSASYTWCCLSSCTLDSTHQWTVSFTCFMIFNSGLSKTRFNVSRKMNLDKWIDELTGDSLIIWSTKILISLSRVGVFEADQFRSRIAFLLRVRCSWREAIQENCFSLFSNRRNSSLISKLETRMMNLRKAYLIFHIYKLKYKHSKKKGISRKYTLWTKE